MNFILVVWVCGILLILVEGWVFEKLFKNILSWVRKIVRWFLMFIVGMRIWIILWSINIMLVVKMILFLDFFIFDWLVIWLKFVVEWMVCK